MPSHYPGNQSKVGGPVYPGSSGSPSWGSSGSSSFGNHLKLDSDINLPNWWFVIIRLMILKDFTSEFSKGITSCKDMFCILGFPSGRWLRNLKLCFVNLNRKFLRISFYLQSQIFPILREFTVLYIGD